MSDKYRKKKMYKTKDWTEFTAESSWRMFKIMAEFVEGFERMDKIGPCVSIYGSARTDPANPYYPLAEKLAARMAQEGFGIITGGGPGIMEAANKGAHSMNGKSVGLILNCHLNSMRIRILIRINSSTSTTSLYGRSCW